LLSTLRSFTESGSSPFALAMTGHSAFELEKVAVASERLARSLIVLIGLQAFNETIQQRSRQAYLGREWCARAVELSGRRLTPLLTSPSRGCRACASRPEPVCASSSIRDAADGSAQSSRVQSGSRTCPLNITVERNAPLAWWHRFANEVSGRRCRCIAGQPFCIP
jgi:hypothetical protein